MLRRYKPSPLLHYIDARLPKNKCSRSALLTTDVESYVQGYLAGSCSTGQHSEAEIPQAEQSQPGLTPSMIISASGELDQLQPLCANRSPQTRKISHPQDNIDRSTQQPNLKRNNFSAIDLVDDEPI